MERMRKYKRKILKILKDGKYTEYGPKSPQRMEEPIMEKGTILVIENNTEIRETIRLLLQAENYRILEAGTGKYGLELLTQQTDLVILEIEMPDMCGIRICEEIRKRSTVPILLLTAGKLEDKSLSALAAGGDDYLVRPFSCTELLGRVKALIRRYQIYQGKDDRIMPEEKEYLELSGIRIFRNANRVFVRGKEISLTDLEYQILRLLMQNPGKIFSARNLYESIWGESYSYTCSSTVMVHIRRLRVKIEKNPQIPEYINTIWGRGYRFEQRRFI